MLTASDRRTESDEQDRSTVISVAPDGSSGVVAAAIKRMDSPPPTAPPSEQPSADLETVLNGPVRMGGDRIELGCIRFAEDQRLGSEAENLRSILYDRYIEDITKRVDSDNRVREAANAWSECMSNFGYREFLAPGDQLRFLFDEVNSAGADRERLDELLLIDRAITQATLECLASSNFDEIRQDVVRDMQIDFVERNRHELDALILLERGRDG